jgi:hypothetical protein
MERVPLLRAPEPRAIQATGLFLVAVGFGASAIVLLVHGQMSEDGHMAATLPPSAYFTLLVLAAGAVLLGVGTFARLCK